MEIKTRALLIVEKIIKDASSINIRLTSDDLINSGVTGELLTEVIEILEKINMIADTGIPDAFERYAKENIKRLRKNLVFDADNVSITELKMLEQNSEIYIGVPLQKTPRGIMSDSGEPLGVNHVNSKKELMKYSDIENTTTPFLINGALVILCKENQDVIS